MHLEEFCYSALEGYAITSVRIEGVEHEFSTISGVVEDVVQKLSLNLKQVRFKRQIEDIDNEICYHISISKKDQLLLVIFKNLSLVFKF
jgi:DNA-directed RNA polymerase subunit alpha